MLLSERKPENGALRKKQHRKWKALILIAGITLGVESYMAMKMFNRPDNDAKVNEPRLKSVPLRNPSYQEANAVYKKLSDIAAKAESDEYFSNAEEYFSWEVMKNLKEALPVVAKLARDCDNEESYELLRKISSVSLPPYRGITADINSIAYIYLNGGKLSNDEIIGAFTIMIMQGEIRRDWLEERADALKEAFTGELGGEKQQGIALNETSGNTNDILGKFKTYNPSYGVIADYVINFTNRSKAGGGTPVGDFNSGAYFERKKSAKINAIKDIIGIADGITKNGQ